MSSENLTDKLTAALAFDESAAFINANVHAADCGLTQRTDSFENVRYGFSAGVEAENARLAPLHLVLVECVKALEFTPCEFFGTDESGSPIHAENCVKCEALDRLAEVLK